MAKKEKTVVDEIMEKSGNGFHSRVVKLLRDEKWTALVSPYYSDNFTDKPREIDVIAEKKFDVHSFMSQWLGTVNVQLFVECKYITGQTVFWFDAKDQVRATERIMTDTGLGHPNENISIQQHHYYANVPVAKLFASEKSRNEDNEIVSKAINQNLNALVYYRNRGDLIPSKFNRRNEVLRRVSYPLIVVNSFDKFFKTNMSDDTGAVEQITEPFQLEVNYAYMDENKNGRNEYFLVDVVSVDTLASFLSELQKSDIKTVAEHISWEAGAERRANSRNGNNSAR
jgi:hypothetical protein